MIEYTPNTDLVRERYASYGVMRDALREDALSLHGAAFDRWLEAHDREVAAKAVRNVATGFIDWDILRGYSEETPRFKEDMKTVEYLEREADRIEDGTVPL